MKRIASVTPSWVLVLLTVVFVALLLPAHADAQRACEQLGSDCNKPSTTQRPPDSQRDSTSEPRSSSEDSFFEIRRYNGNVSKIRKSRKLSLKGEAAIEKKQWSDGAKFFNEAVKALPTSFKGGSGSAEQQRDVAERLAAAWAKHAYCIYNTGQRELAISQFRWVAENNAARPEDVEWARKSIVFIEAELYEMAREKKKQDALKMHRSDFHP